MATLKSDQLTRLESVPSSRLKPNEQGGRLRCARWSFTTPAGGVAINDVIRLVKIPAGAAILVARACWEAMGGTGTSVSVGISGNATKYLGATSVVAAGNVQFADTVALNQGEELTAETEIIATGTVAAWAAAKKFQGYIIYALD